MHFKNCQITINNKNLIAQSASVEELASLTPNFILGFKGNAGFTPNSSLNNKINIDYLIETHNEPNYDLIQEIKNYVFSSFPIQIVIAGITGAAYLESYNLNISPNNITTASAQFVSFNPFVGSPTNQPTGLIYNSTNNSGFGHYWSTFAKLNNETATGSILQANYTFQANWNPIYKIGTSTPFQVKFLNAQETFNITSEYYPHVTYSGENIEERINNVEIIEINHISSLWSSAGTKLTLFPSGGKIINNKITFNESTPIISESTIIKNY